MSVMSSPRIPRVLSAAASLQAGSARHMCFAARRLRCTLELLAKVCSTYFLALVKVHVLAPPSGECAFTSSAS